MLHFSPTEQCKGLVQLAAQIEVYLARSSTMPSLPLKIEATASAAVIRESTEVIAAGQERGINAPEIIPVALEPVTIEEQVETVAYEIFNHVGHHGCARLIAH